MRATGILDILPTARHARAGKVFELAGAEKPHVSDLYKYAET